MELLVEGFAFRQHGVDDRGEFLGDQRTGNRFAFAALPPLELGLHFWGISDRADRGVVKRDLQIAIPIARALVACFAAGVVRPRHQATIGVEVANRRKSCDVINLEEERLGDHLTDPGHPHQTLRLRSSEYAIAEFVVETADCRRTPKFPQG